MKKKIIIIGAGGWGYNYVRKILNHPGWEIAAFVDINKKVHHRLIHEFHIPKNKIYSDYRLALKEKNVDAATLSVPNPARMPILKELLNRDIHILVDKPLVHTIADLRRLVNWKKKSKSILMVAQNYRYDPLTRKIKKLMDKKQFGDLSHILIKFMRDLSFMKNPLYLNMPGDLALVVEMSVHHFDFLRYLLDMEPVRIFAQSWRPNWAWGKGNTGLHVLMEFPKNIHVTYYADWAQPGEMTSWGGNWLLTFNKGILSWEQGSEKPVEWIPGAVKSGKPVKPIQFHQYKSKEPSTIATLGLTFETFHKALHNKGLPETDISDNIMTMMICFAVLKSSQTGKMIEFNKFYKQNRP